MLLNIENLKIEPKRRLQIKAQIKFYFNYVSSKIVFFQSKVIANQKYF